MKTKKKTKKKIIGNEVYLTKENVKSFLFITEGELKKIAKTDKSPYHVRLNDIFEYFNLPAKKFKNLLNDKDYVLHILELLTCINNGVKNKELFSLKAINSFYRTKTLILQYLFKNNILSIHGIKHLVNLEIRNGQIFYSISLEVDDKRFYFHQLYSTDWGHIFKNVFHSPVIIFQYNERALEYNFDYDDEELYKLFYYLNFCAFLLKH